MIDMNEIARLNRRYKFKIKQINDCTCHVDDGVGEWLIQVHSPPCQQRKNIILKHKNYKRNKDGWHVQSRYYDYTWVMGAINNHKLKPFKTFDYLFKLNETFKILGL